MKYTRSKLNVLLGEMHVYILESMFRNEEPVRLIQKRWRGYKARKSFLQLLTNCKRLSLLVTTAYKMRILSQKRSLFLKYRELFHEKIKRSREERIF